MILPHNKKKKTEKKKKKKQTTPQHHQKNKKQKKKKQNTSYRILPSATYLREDFPPSALDMALTTSCAPRLTGRPHAEKVIWAAIFTTLRKHTHTHTHTHTRTHTHTHTHIYTQIKMRVKKKTLNKGINEEMVLKSRTSDFNQTQSTIHNMANHFWPDPLWYISVKQTHYTHIVHTHTHTHTHTYIYIYIYI